jgi:hypothetical protein
MSSDETMVEQMAALAGQTFVFSCLLERLYLGEVPQARRWIGWGRISGRACATSSDDTLTHDISVVVLSKLKASRSPTGHYRLGEGLTYFFDGETVRRALP